MKIQPIPQPLCSCNVKYVSITIDLISRLEGSLEESETAAKLNIPNERGDKKCSWVQSYSLYTFVNGFLFLNDDGREMSF